MDRTLPTEKETQQHRRSRLASILSGGLPALPSCVFDLDVLLSAPIVDLKKVSEVIRSEPRLCRRILRLSNTVLPTSSSPVQTISEAVVLYGPDYFRALVLICAITRFAAREFRDEIAAAFWPHSALVASVSERIAEWSEYPVRGLAYLAGLLHDIGHLPLMMVAREQEATGHRFPSDTWRDNLELEREFFGLDHCEIGRWMAMSWKFSSSLLDAVQHHHDPSRANQDPHIAEIVGTAEYFCSGRFTSSEADQFTGPARLLQARFGKDNGENLPLVSEFLRGEDGFSQAVQELTWALQRPAEKASGKRFRN
jgi:HD-like signal output (HDOD) protein